MTRNDERVAGGIALLTAATLIASLALLGSGPPNAHPSTVLTWYLQHTPQVRLGTLSWLVAVLGLVAFSVRLRDALLGLTADRWWSGVLFVQGAAVFAAVAVVAAAATWAAADRAGTIQPDAGTVTTLWALHTTLLRFATWGLTVPLATAGIALFRHSLLGRLASLLGVVVAGLLLIPATWIVGLPAFAVWLALTGWALLQPGRAPAIDHEMIR